MTLLQLLTFIFISCCLFLNILLLVLVIVENVKTKKRREVANKLLSDLKITVTELRSKAVTIEELKAVYSILNNFNERIASNEQITKMYVKEKARKVVDIFKEIDDELNKVILEETDKIKKFVEEGEKEMEAMKSKSKSKSGRPAKSKDDTKITKQTNKNKTKK